MTVPNKILVLRFSSLGDIVMTTAMLRCVRNRFPNAQIDLVVRSDFLDLVRFNPHLSKIIGLPRRSGWYGLIKLLGDINVCQYDLVYDAHRSLRTRLLMPFIRAPAKVYFRKQYIRRTLALALKLPLLDTTRFLEKFIRPLAPFGVCFDGKGPEMFVDAAFLTSALAETGLFNDGTPRIGVIPCAQWPGKRWPMGKFRDVVRKLVETTRYQILVFGGREDTFCSQIVSGFPANRVVNTQGKLSILESAALIQICSFVIANDTGLMHVADALSVPAVLIFGPTSADLGCLPYHPKTRVVEHVLWCRPCSKNGQAPCIRKRRWCLEQTHSDRVFDEALRLEQSLLNH